MKEISLLIIGMGIGYMYCKARMAAKAAEVVPCTHCKGSGKEPVEPTAK